MSKDTFLYPLLYTGPKAVKAVTVPGALEPAMFKQGPLSSQFGGLPYADVTEKQGRHLVKHHGNLFAWPEGTKLGPQFVTREEHDALADRLAKLEALLATEEPKPAPKASRSAKAAEAAHVEAKQAEAVEA